MADDNSSQPIPEGWKFETKPTRDGDQFSRYVCLRTGQHFYTYEGMMRYVNYAREAQLPVYMANFDFGKDYKLNVGDLTPEAIINNVEVMESTEFDEKVSGTKANHLPREVRKVHEVCEVQLCQEQKPVETINVEAFSLWNTASNDEAPALGVTASNVGAPAPGFTASNVEAPSPGVTASNVEAPGSKRKVSKSIKIKKHGRRSKKN